MLFGLSDIVEYVGYGDDRVVTLSFCNCSTSYTCLKHGSVLKCNCSTGNICDLHKIEYR